MADNSLQRIPLFSKKRSELRDLIKKYLQADSEIDQYSWENITVENGLAHNWVYDIFQDSSGRIWVATWGGGLALFENQKWRIYTRADGLHCNEVTCIREDGCGAIWIATDDGLNIIKGNQIQDGGLTHKSLLNLTFDRDGKLWAGCWRATHSGGGLYRYDGHKWDSFTTRQNLPGQEIMKVFEDSKGQIWVGTYEQGMGAGVGCFNGHQWQNYTEKDGLADNCVYSMFEDPSGNMWFGTVKGISIFDGKRWHNLTSKDGLVDNRVYCMLIDSKKKMWFGTEGGVSRYDGCNWRTFNKNDSLVENLVRTIIETKDGSLWFGTYPYAKGKGGISIARNETAKSITEKILDLLPEPKQPKQLTSGSEEG